MSADDGCLAYIFYVKYRISFVGFSVLTTSLCLSTALTDVNKLLACCWNVSLMVLSFSACKPLLVPLNTIRKNRRCFSFVRSKAEQAGLG